MSYDMPLMEMGWAGGGWRNGLGEKKALKREYYFHCHLTGIVHCRHMEWISYKVLLSSCSNVVCLFQLWHCEAKRKRQTLCVVRVDNDVNCHHSLFRTSGVIFLFPSALEAPDSLTDTLFSVCHNDRVVTANSALSYIYRASLWVIQ